MDGYRDVCLEALEDSETVKLRPCQFDNRNQQWTFQHYVKEYDDLISGKTQVETGTWQHRLLQLYREFVTKPLDNSSFITTGRSV